MAKMTISEAAAILRIPVTASPEELRKAYRKLTLQYHPDRNPDDANAEEMIRKINTAHAVFEQYLQSAGHTNIDDNVGNAARNNNASGTMNADSLLQHLWQNYQKAHNEHKDFVSSEVIPLRKNIEDIESKLPGLELDEKIQSVQRLQVLLMQCKMKIATSTVMYKHVKKCLELYNEAAERLGRVKYQEGR